MQDIVAKLPSWLPAYWVAVTLGRVAITVAVLYGLTRASALHPREHRRTVGIAAGLLALWALGAIVGGRAGWFELDPTVMFPPPIFIGLIGPLFAGYLLFRHWGPFRTLVLAVPPYAVVLLQVLRMSGGIFLYVYALDAVPGLFGLTAGIGDLTTGLLGLPVAYLLFRGTPGSRRLALGWNAVALFELIVLMPVGMVTSPALPQLTAFDAPNYVTSFWPSVLAPTFHVPLGMLLHVYGFAQLSADRDKAKTKPSNLGWQLVAICAATYALYAFLFYVASPMVAGRQVAFHIHPIIRESFTDRYVPLYIHIAFSAFALVAGPLQFLPAVRQRWPRLHRVTGRIYIVGGVFAGGSARSTWR